MFGSTVIIGIISALVLFAGGIVAYLFAKNKGKAMKDLISAQQEKEKSVDEAKEEQKEEQEAENKSYKVKKGVIDKKANKAKEEIPTESQLEEMEDSEAEEKLLEGLDNV